MDDVRIGLIGAGRIGGSHARLLAERVPGARLVMVADPRPEAARELADRFGAVAADDPAALLAADLDAVVITASSSAHSELIVAAAQARQGDLLREARVDDPGRGRPCPGRRRRGRGDPPGRLQPPVRRRLPGRPRRGGGRGGRHRPAHALADPRPGAGRPGVGAAVDDLPADADPRLRRAAVAEPGGHARRGVRHRRRAGRAGLQGLGAARHGRGRDHVRQRRPGGGGGELLRGLRVRRPRPRCSGRRGMVTAGDGARTAMVLRDAAACTRRPSAATWS